MAGPARLTNTVPDGSIRPTRALDGFCAQACWGTAAIAAPGVGDVGVEELAAHRVVVGDPGMGAAIAGNLVDQLGGALQHFDRLRTAAARSLTKASRH